MRRQGREVFWASIDTSAGINGCWPWLGNRNDNGYGRVRADGRIQYVHRIALELHLGRPIADGLFACHTCDNPPCCNPLHLFEGSHADNAADMAVKDRGQRAWLSAADVRAIRSSRERPDVLAARYGVSLRTVYRALHASYRPRRAA